MIPIHKIPYYVPGQTVYLSDTYAAVRTCVVKEVRIVVRNSGPDLAYDLDPIDGLRNRYHPEREAPWQRVPAHPDQVFGDRSDAEAHRDARLAEFRKDM